MGDAPLLEGNGSDFITGVHVRMHKGTVCRLGRSDWCCFNAPRCMVLAFDHKERKWQVQLEPGGMKILVPEHALRLGYCLLPSSLNGHTAHVEWKLKENAFLHRPQMQQLGLAVQQHTKRDALLFEDKASVVIPSPAAGLDRWYESWLAYNAMRAIVEDELLIAFSAMEYRSAHNTHLRHGVKYTFSKIGGTALEHVWKQMEGALGRFQANAFSFPNNLMDSDKEAQAAMCASAIYAFASHINHSCDANCALVSKEQYCTEKGR